jgi:hypothetical protein
MPIVAILQAIERFAGLSIVHGDAKDKKGIPGLSLTNLKDGGAL